MAGNKIISLIEHAKAENLADITAMLQIIEDEFLKIENNVIELTQRLIALEERMNSTN